MSQKRDKLAASRKKSGRDPVEAQIDGLVASSKPAPEHIRHEVHEAIDRLVPLLER